MARRKKKVTELVKGDEWLPTYADTVTLLLTFFVLLYSMATVDAEKTKNIANAFTSMMEGKSADSLMEYNLYNGDVPLEGGGIEDNVVVGDGLTEKERIYTDVRNFVSENDLESVVEIVNDEKGVLMQLKDNVLFETSSSNLKEGSKDVLDKINSIISSVSNPISIEGHTDSRPISTSEFPTNWELSVDRAVNVVRYFIEVKGQDPIRFSASGYGEFHPIASNDTQEDMARNRRVSILIVTTEKGEENNG